MLDPDALIEGILPRGSLNIFALTSPRSRYECPVPPKTTLVGDVGFTVDLALLLGGLCETRPDGVLADPQLCGDLA
jgi:hypothetical protein